ncbi:MAG: DUF167 domain-containing protein [Candidatus Bathyarchaeia archaeon]|jgi:uncharacterized protein (TIGR00251 family)
MKLRETEKGLILDVYVKPRSKEFRIMVEGDEIVVHCSEEPVGGRVNRELMKELSRLFGKKVELVSGSSSRQKRLLVKDAEKSEIERALMGA